MEKQWKAMGEQGKIMQGQLEVTRQAFVANVGIREITMGQSFSVGQIPTLYVTWYNGGQTAAARFRASPYLVFGEKPEEKGFAIEDDWSSSKGNFLPPGKPQILPYPQSEFGFKPGTKEMLAELEGGSKRLYAMVYALYFDFTGQERPFEASYIYDHWQKMFIEL